MRIELYVPRSKSGSKNGHIVQYSVRHGD